MRYTGEPQAAAPAARRPVRRARTPSTMPPCRPRSNAGTVIGDRTARARRARRRRSSTQGRRIPGVFQQRSAGDARKEVAAYRLDRTSASASCPRRSSARCRASAAWCRRGRAKWVTQADVQQQSLRAGGWCALEPQFQLVYAFDATGRQRGPHARDAAVRRGRVVRLRHESREGVRHRPRLPGLP